MFFEDIGLTQYIFLSFALLGIGLFGLLSNKSNIISYIISLEIMFLAINLILISIGRYIGNMQGQALLIFILSITAAEIVVILGLVIFHYKTYGEISIESTKDLKEC